MTAFVIDDSEWALMRKVDHLARDLYVSLRRRMDYATGIVGGEAGAAVSWWALREDTELEGRPGVRGCKPSEQQLRRRIEQLEKVGLVESIGTKLRLRFRLLLARRSSLDPKKAGGGVAAPESSGNANAGKAPRSYSHSSSASKAGTHQVSGKTSKPSPPTPSRLRRDGDGKTINPPAPEAREAGNPDATPSDAQAQQLSEQRHEPIQCGGNGPAARQSEKGPAADVAFERHLAWPRGIEQRQRAYIARTSRDLGPRLAQRVLDEWHGAKQAGVVNKDWPYFNALVRQAKEHGEAWETVYAEQVAADREAERQRQLEQALREQQFDAAIGKRPGPLARGMLARLVRLRSPS